MCGTKLRHIRKTLVKLVSRTRCHSSRENSINCFRRFIPALLIKMWTPSKALRTSRSSWQTFSTYETSAGKDSALPPTASTSSFTAFSCSRSRETSARFAPAEPSARAMALPRPLLAPVMTATLPCRSYSFIDSFLGEILPSIKFRRQRVREASLGGTLWPGTEVGERMEKGVAGVQELQNG